LDYPGIARSLARLDATRRVSYNLAGVRAVWRTLLLWKFSNVVHILSIIIQAICALALVVLMAIQTDKAEQGGVMGIGGAGGRDAGEIDMAVGPERILKPLTRWIAGGFVTSSILAAIPAAKINFVYVAIAIALYVVAMLYGGLLWQTVTGMKKS
jgi:preprotein translocase subunit SecG